MREEIKWFVNEMEKVLSKNDYKGGWKFEEHGYLFDRLQDECLELKKELKKKNKKAPSILKECVDIANFSMMIADIYRPQSKI